MDVLLPKLGLRVDACEGLVQVQTTHNHTKLNYVIEAIMTVQHLHTSGWCLPDLELYLKAADSNSLSHSLSHSVSPQSVTHAVTHSSTQSITQSLLQSLTHSANHSLTHRPTH